MHPRPPVASARTVYRQLGLLLSGLGVVALGACAPEAAAPVQPIAFDHARHARAGIECAQCHPGALRGPRAGIAPLSVCASCHFGTRSEHPEVRKVLEHYARKEPLQWRKVTVLPASAMVHFTHRPHTRVGVACPVCHGEVAAMGVARRAVALDMAFCVACHEREGASVDCLTCHH